MTSVNIIPESPAPDQKSAYLHEKLVESGQALGSEELQTFLFSIHSDGGEMIAACKGEIAFQSARISEIWVDPNQRGKGLGKQLLSATEEYVSQKNCTRIHLETRSELARKLYEKVGFRVFGKLDNYDGNIPFYYLEKPVFAVNGTG